jgi:AraC-like DNA-binding protein
VLGSWSRTIVRALEALGIEGGPLVERSGIDPADFADPNARHPNTATNELWRLATEATGDPCFGLTASRYVTQTTFQALGYSVLASTSIREVFERYVRYGRVVSDAAVLRLETDGALARLIYGVPDGPGRPADPAMDAILSLAVRTARALQDRDLNPEEVWLAHPEPKPSEGYRRVFRAPVRFDADDYALLYENAELDRPLPSGNAELAKQTDEVVARYLQDMETDETAAALGRWLVAKLPTGEPDQETAARALGLSLRSLQRRLAEEGTSYRELLAATRLELARGYLGRERYSITEITFLLGFADASGFSRAFRRWTGTSPSSYRAEVLGA